jgi:hypothetical protein
MQVVNVSKFGPAKFPEALMSAQQAMNLPEVQEMLARLSAYNLGIFMPHGHDAQTGDFQELPADVVQVESGLAVSFQTTEQFASQAERFLPVAWRWHAGAPALAAACEMASTVDGEDSEDRVQHKMPAPN